MAQRHFVLIDATLESQAPFFAQNPIFQWLHSYNNVPEALEYITGITSLYTIQVYMSRDNILDDGLPSGRNGETRTLIQTFCDLKTIHHVSIFAPEINTEVEQGFRNILPDPRLIKDVISVIDLHSYICKEGEQYFQHEITRCKSKNEAHLIPNLLRNIDELTEYWEKVMNDRKKICETWVEEHSNKPSEESS